MLYAGGPVPSGDTRHLAYDRGARAGDAGQRRRTLVLHARKPIRSRSDTRHRERQGGRAGDCPSAAVEETRARGSSVPVAGGTGVACDRVGERARPVRRRGDTRALREDRSLVGDTGPLAGSRGGQAEARRATREDSWSTRGPAETCTRTRDISRATRVGKRRSIDADARKLVVAGRLPRVPAGSRCSTRDLAGCRRPETWAAWGVSPRENRGTGRRPGTPTPSSTRRGPAGVCRRRGFR